MNLIETLAAQSHGKSTGTHTDNLAKLHPVLPGLGEPTSIQLESTSPAVGRTLAELNLRGMTGGFTLGGLQTSVDSEVLHVDGDPIPGLYAAGRCTSGLSAWGYCSGISLGDGSFFGRRAGIRAASK